LHNYICLGLSTLDYTWSVPQIPDHPTKVLAQGFAVGGGGMAATAAVTIARLDGRVAFWGRAGDDTTGAAMRQLLAAEEVNVDHLRLFAQAASPVAAVLVDPLGERLITTFQGQDLPTDARWLPLADVAKADAVLADMRWIDGALALFTEARACGVTTILDADIAAQDDYARVLALTDHVIFSSSGLAAFAPDVPAADGLTAAAQYGCTLAAVTNGAQGTLWLSADGLQHTPAFAVDTVDTTGAGDVFHGAYTLGVGQSYPIAQAMTFASAVAALKCTQAGARAGIPSQAQITQLLESMS